MLSTIVSGYNINITYIDKLKGDSSWISVVATYVCSYSDNNLTGNLMCKPIRIYKVSESN